MNRTTALSLVLTVTQACASGPAPEPVEVIPRVPSYVLSIQDLEARVRLARQDLGVQLRGVRVAAVLIRTTCGSGEPTANESGPCPDGALGRHVFETRSEGERAEMMAEILPGAPPLQAGHTYVLVGDVEPSSAAPKRWILRGHVLAVVGP